MLLSKNVIITRDNLNVRSGAGFDKPVIKTAIPGTYKALDIKSNFAKIGRNEWVCLDYVTLEDVESKPINKFDAEEKEDE